MDDRLTTIVHLWSYLHSKQREKILRLSGNLAVSTVEEHLCALHRRALNALIKSREPSELLRGYSVKKMGRSRRIKNRVKKLNERYCCFHCTLGINNYFGWCGCETFIFCSVFCVQLLRRLFCLTLPQNSAWSEHLA